MALVVPAEVQKMADQQKLGAFVKHHTRLSRNLPYILIAFFLLLLSLALVLLALAIYFSSDTPDWKNFEASIFFSLIIALTSILYFFISVPELVLSAYEYSDGFIEFNKKKQRVVHIIHWDNVESTRVHISRYGAKYDIIPFASPHKMTYTITYRGIWKRCEQAIAEREKKNLPLVAKKSK